MGNISPATIKLRHDQAIRSFDIGPLRQRHFKVDVGGLLIIQPHGRITLTTADESPNPEQAADEGRRSHDRGPSLFSPPRCARTCSALRPCSAKPLTMAGQ